MMKNKRNALVWALCISMIFVAAVGAFIKYGVLRPLALYQEKNFVELPFLLLCDSGMRMTIQDAMELPDLPEDTCPGESLPDVTLPSASTTESSAATDGTTAETTQPGTEYPTQIPTELPETDPPITEPPATEAPVTDPPQTNPPETDPPKTEPPETAPPVTEATVPSFEFTGPAVDLSWFDDVLFIGDSRTVGLRDYARSGNADYFCGVGMSSFNILTKTASDDRFAEQTLESLLSSKTYGKIFINLGINECGYPTNSLMKAYQKVVDLVRQTQPDAIIILHGIMNVGRSKASGKDYFQPEHLADINQKICALANGTDIFYINVNDVFTDSDGYLLSAVSGDGCHLYAKYDIIWADWIRYAVAALGL